MKGLNHFMVINFMKYLSIFSYFNFNELLKYEYYCANILSFTPFFCSHFFVLFEQKIRTKSVRISYFWPYSFLDYILQYKRNKHNLTVKGKLQSFNFYSKVKEKLRKKKNFIHKKEIIHKIKYPKITITHKKANDPMSFTSLLLSKKVYWPI
jgi:hypothetical protein